MNAPPFCLPDPKSRKMVHRRQESGESEDSLVESKYPMRGMNSDTYRIHITHIAHIYKSPGLEERNLAFRINGKSRKSLSQGASFSGRKTINRGRTISSNSRRRNRSSFRIWCTDEFSPRLRKRLDCPRGRISRLRCCRTLRGSLWSRGSLGWERFGRC